MAQLFEIRDGVALVGSFSGDQIRQMTADGRIHAGMEIRPLPTGQWAPISRVKGLQFTSLRSGMAAAPEPIKAQSNGTSTSPAGASSADRLPPRPLPMASPSAPNATTSGAVVAVLAPDPGAVQAAATQPPPPSQTAATTGAAEIECPFCAELIKATAKKCKHCGEFLDETLRAAAGEANVRTIDSSGQIVPPDSDIDVNSVAMNQNRLRYCGLAFWLLQLFSPIALALGEFFYIDSELVLYSPFFISWLFNYAAAVFAFFLAMKVFDAGMGMVLGLLGLIPYFGPAAFLAISVRASYLLRQHGRRSRPRWLAVVFPAVILSPTIFVALALALTALFPLDSGEPGPAPILILLGTALFFGGALVTALLLKE